MIVASEPSGKRKVAERLSSAMTGAAPTSVCARNANTIRANRNRIGVEQPAAKVDEMYGLTPNTSAPLNGVHRPMIRGQGTGIASIYDHFRAVHVLQALLGLLRPWGKTTVKAYRQ